MATNIVGNLPELVKLLISLTSGFRWIERHGDRGRPYVYKTKTVVNAFIVTSTVLLPGKTLVPLAWKTTLANHHDSKPFIPLMEETVLLAEKSARKIRYSLGDKAYDINKNYYFCHEHKFRLVTPVRRFKNRTEISLKERTKKFVDSPTGKMMYQRRADNGRFYAQLKDLFLVDPLPVTGYQKVQSYLSIVCLAYLLGILYNHLNGRSLRAIKSLAT